MTPVLFCSNPEREEHLENNLGDLSVCVQMDTETSFHTSLSSILLLVSQPLGADQVYH